jgi:hypothetical protein
MESRAISRWLQRHGHRRRAVEYLRVHPEDEPAVNAILVAMETLGHKSAREIAQVTAAREISEVEWATYGPRWERAWNFVMKQSAL